MRSIQILEYAKSGDLASLLQVIKSDKDAVNLCEQGGNQAIHYAAQAGHVHILEALIQNGAKINAQNHRKETSLHFATWERWPKCISVLLKLNADKTIKNQHGEIAEDYTKVPNYNFPEIINAFKPLSDFVKKDSVNIKFFKKTAVAADVKESQLTESDSKDDEWILVNSI